MKKNVCLSSRAAFCQIRWIKSICIDKLRVFGLNNSMEFSMRTKHKIFNQYNTNSMTRGLARIYFRGNGTMYMLFLSYFRKNSQLYQCLSQNFGGVCIPAPPWLRHCPWHWKRTLSAQAKIASKLFHMIAMMLIVKNIAETDFLLWRGTSNHCRGLRWLTLLCDELAFVKQLQRMKYQCSM